MRFSEIERKLMIAELNLDGLKTHTTMRKEKCVLYNTPYDKKIRLALSAVRSARDMLRNDSKQKQRTLTTRSNSANRHGLWFCKVIPDWKCGFCNANK